ncbi:glycosyl hydrolase family 28-related protein [Spirochaetota bacterium]
MKKQIVRTLFISLIVMVFSSMSAYEHKKTCIEKAKKHNRNQFMTKFGTIEEIMEKWVMPYVEGPMPGGIDLTLPKGLGNIKLAELGFLDVTAKPFMADPTGKKDSTKSIQEAINFARDHYMVAFFPAGTYKISDTIICHQVYALRGNGKISVDKNCPVVLVGSSKDRSKRAKLYLASRSKGFDDPKSFKLVVHYKTVGRESHKGGFEGQQANVSFNNIFHNIDIEIGEGNPGAVGIRLQGAEGSSIQDITIDATHGLGGMWGSAGSGGSHYNVTIIGGQFGIDTHGMPPEFLFDGTGTQPTPVLGHFTFINQRENAIINRSRGPLICAGIKIHTKTKGPVIYSSQVSSHHPLDGSIALIDSEIVFENPDKKNTVVDSTRSFYFNNVYIKGAGMIRGGSSKCNVNGWTHIEHFAEALNPPLATQDKKYKVQFDESPYVNGEKLTEPWFIKTDGKEPPSDLRSLHIWPDDFPTFESPGAVNVKDSQFGVMGDGIADDTGALQKVIDAHEIIFLPKGYYRLTDSLKLKPNTKIIGAAQHLSMLIIKDEYQAFTDPEKPKPYIETADDADAETYLAFFGMIVPFRINGKYPSHKTAGYYALKWSCGKRSIMRFVYISPAHLDGLVYKGDKTITDIAWDNQTALVTGSGAGKWYTYMPHNNGNLRATKRYRHLRIENTKGPLWIYTFDTALYNSKIKDGLYTVAGMDISGSENISIFGVKAEHGTRNGNIIDSKNIRIFGHGGAGKPGKGNRHYYFENCKEFLVSTFADQVELKENSKRKPDMHSMYEIVSGKKKFVLPYNERPVVYYSNGSH